VTGPSRDPLAAPRGIGCGLLIALWLLAVLVATLLVLTQTPAR
jgi:hypothetical protein